MPARAAWRWTHRRCASRVTTTAPSTRPAALQRHAAARASPHTAWRLPPLRGGTAQCRPFVASGDPVPSRPADRDSRHRAPRRTPRGALTTLYLCAGPVQSAKFSPQGLLAATCLLENGLDDALVVRHLMRVRSGALVNPSGNPSAGTTGACGIDGTNSCRVVPGFPLEFRTAPVTILIKMHVVALAAALHGL